MKNPWIISLCLLIAPVFSSYSFEQTCSDVIPASTPLDRFTIHDDATVTDTKTNLMWQTCIHGQDFVDGTCRGGSAGNSWSLALDIAENSTFAGYEDWRLPNIKELLSIVEHRCVNPALDLDVFPGAVGYALWSSSPFNNSSYIWFVYMDDGTSWHDEENYVPYNFKLVRDIIQNNSSKRQLKKIV